MAGSRDLAGLHVRDARLVIYNLAGQPVRVLRLGYVVEGGAYTVVWDGRNERDEEVASGVYVYRLETERFTLGRRMVLLR